MKTEKNLRNNIFTPGIDLDPVDRHFAQTNLDWTQLGSSHAVACQAAKKEGNGQNPMFQRIVLTDSFAIQTGIHPKSIGKERLRNPIMVFSQIPCRVRHLYLNEFNDLSLQELRRARESGSIETSRLAIYGTMLRAA